jgi:dTDP-4-dehydrorhamnose 3,5-epimerase
MDVIKTSLPGVLLIRPRIFRDDRGSFLETWQRERYADAGLPETFVQDNSAVSTRGVLRGLHYQHPRAQGKLVMALQGEVFDVAVDIRPESPHFGRWYGALLSGANGHQLWIPAGFAHGFAVSPIRPSSHTSAQRPTTRTATPRWPGTIRTSGSSGPSPIRSSRRRTSQHHGSATSTRPSAGRALSPDGSVPVKVPALSESGTGAGRRWPACPRNQLCGHDGEAQDQGDGHAVEPIVK